MDDILYDFDVNDQSNWPIDKIGIYSIRGKYNDFNLVGQTSNKQGFKCRWQRHIRLLKNNKHYNKFIQSAWNKYGDNQFKIVILECCELNDDLNLKEIKWIHHLKSFYDDGFG